MHEINRTGSMLDNIIYFNIALERTGSPELLDELLRDASETVSLQRDTVVFKYLIVQPRDDAATGVFRKRERARGQDVIENLGDCIKNNAAANIFNEDLDARNYGVSHFLKVYLFDYDALEDRSKSSSLMPIVTTARKISRLVFRRRLCFSARGNRSRAVHA